MTRKHLIQLGCDSVIEILNENEPETVMYKSGVWNKYSLCKTEDIIESIINAPYGVDLDIDEETGIYYICRPCDSDMW